MEGCGQWVSSQCAQALTVIKVDGAIVSALHHDGTHRGVAHPLPYTRTGLVGRRLLLDGCGRGCGGIWRRGRCLLREGDGTREGDGGESETGIGSESQVANCHG